MFALWEVVATSGVDMTQFDVEKVVAEHWKRIAKAGGGGGSSNRDDDDDDDEDDPGDSSFVCDFLLSQKSMPNFPRVWKALEKHIFKCWQYDQLSVSGLVGECIAFLSDGKAVQKAYQNFISSLQRFAEEEKSLLSSGHTYADLGFVEGLIRNHSFGLGKLVFEWKLTPQALEAMQVLWTFRSRPASACRDNITGAICRCLLVGHQSLSAEIASEILRALVHELLPLSEDREEWQPVLMLADAVGGDFRAAVVQMSTTHQ
jgi:hypothetical protein